MRGIKTTYRRIPLPREPKTVKNRRTFPLFGGCRRDEIDPSLPFGGKVEGRGATIGEASVVATPRRFKPCGQIFAAGKLRSDRRYNFFDCGIRFHRPLLSFCRFCFGQANALFDRGQSFVFVRELSPSDIEISPESLASAADKSRASTLDCCLQLRHVRLSPPCFPIV